MIKVFAPDFERNDKGWILFPPDTSARDGVFPVEVNKHPAKANLHLVQAVIEYVSEPGETLMDIMAGTGTILYGVLMGRRVICIEITDKFFKLIQQGADNIEKIAPGSESMITLINQPCQTVLPISVDHIIFSPPYAQIMKSKGTDKLTIEKTDYDMSAYTMNPLNVGQVNEFIYHHLMELVYKKCYESLRPGGTLTIIIKDHMKNRQRVEISGRAAKDCQAMGFKLVDWFKWAAPGSVYTHIYRARGWEVCDDEDIIVLQK